MSRVFIGSEASTSGFLTKYELARSYQRVLPDVYAPPGELSLEDRITAAWLWSRRKGIVTGAAASAIHGADWVTASTPVELNLPNNRSPRGVIARNDTIFDDEVVIRRGLPVTTLTRTAFDLARRGSERQAVARLDALARVCHLDHTGVVALKDRHPHVRNLLRVPQVLELVDDGAESPQESFLRLTLIDAGFTARHPDPVPRPHGRRYHLDMGWPDLMVAVEYDGEHHRTDRSAFVRDVERSEYLAEVGWVVVRVR